ncbi:MAG: polysaccharide deacetylase family protein [Gammaproteobacteria bacterium]|nr:polysaccharide deacetylase family protein [Gammaproteobacteria bacterium]MCP5299381.1 polysaccharide deacetylase family protein [Chromatiaceae bacterium]
MILQYHHISDETPGITSVTPQQFQDHLDYLLTHDHVVLPLTEVVEHLQDGRELPDKCVALTIDDAYVSAYTEAFPRTRRYGYPLTVFVSTEAVDRGYSSHVSWDQVREMQAAGIRFENHSHTHDHLIRQADDESAEDWAQRVATDILTAQNRIQEELGTRPTLFAYPYGEYNDELRSIVESMGFVAFGQQSGPAWHAADLRALPRFPMASFYAGMRTFPNKVNSLPLPITGAFPTDPVVPLDEWQPALTLVFAPEVPNREDLTCFFNGSPEVSYEWLDQPSGGVVIQAKGRLNVGRNRTNCTLPVGDTGRFGWYSHNWIRREADGSWYRESR